MNIIGQAALKLAADTKEKQNDYNWTADDKANYTIIEWDSLFGMIDESGAVQATDSTQTVAVRADNITMTDLTISNWYNSHVHFNDANYHAEHRALAILIK